MEVLGIWGMLNQASTREGAALGAGDTLGNRDPRPSTRSCRPSVAAASKSRPGCLSVNITAAAIGCLRLTTAAPSASIHRRVPHSKHPSGPT